MVPNIKTQRGKEEMLDKMIDKMKEKDADKSKMSKMNGLPANHGWLGRGQVLTSSHASAYNC